MCSDFNIEKITCSTRDMSSICKALRTTLAEFFEESSATVVDCPDLTKPPYYLASPGLCGNPCIADRYDAAKIGQLMGCSSGLLIGAGAAPHHRTGFNGEWVCNMSVPKVGEAVAALGNRIYIIDQSNDDIKEIDCATSEFAILGNLYGCKGQLGKVIHVTASRRRTDAADFISIIRECLRNSYPGETIALGGVFLIENGAAKFHVMPREFSQVPLNNSNEVDEWLRFYELKAPLTCVGVVLSRDPGHDLRLIHFHGFSASVPKGGHYHYDVTKDGVAYNAYLNVAECIYRVDRPQCV